MGITLRYQAKHPQLPRDDPQIHGRVSLEKRAAYNREVVKAIVPDARLADIIMDAHTADPEKKGKIAQYAVRKAGGDSAKALEFLEGIRTMALSGKHSEKSVVNEENLQRVAKKNRLDERSYAIQTSHLMSDPLGRVQRDVLQA